MLHSVILSLLIITVNPLPVDNFPQISFKI